MKKVLAYSTLVLLGSGCVAWANQAASKSHRVQADLGPGCHIAITLPQSATSRIGNGGNPNFGEGGLRVEPFPKGWKSTLDALYFGVWCKASDNEDVLGGTFPIAFDSVKHEWFKDASKWEQEAREATDAVDKQALTDLVNTTHVFNIYAVNSQGWIMTQQDLIGDEDARQRSMSFCLLHPPKALCGLGKVARLVDGSRGDLTKQALEIIKSIEFLDDAPQGLPSSSTGTPHK